MEAIQLEIGLELVPFVKSEDVQEGNLINSIRQMRRDMERADHYLIPPIRICDNTNLPPRGYQIFIYERAVAGGELSYAHGVAELSSHLENNIRQYAVEAN